ncbi:MAG TPA: hypothetical protein VF463_09090 [Sphingobium sp.]
MTPTRLLGLILSMTVLTASLASDGPPSDANQGEWLPVPPQSLEVARGSALDLSALVPAAPAGSQGVVHIDGNGRLVAGTTVDPRFNCAMIANGPAMTWAMPDHAEADALAIQLRRAGYNLVRLHFMDARLMRGAKSDFAFDPQAMDRYQYLLAALKRQGISWMLDMLTAPNGARVQNFSGPRSVNDLKVRLNFDPQARQEWLRLVDAIYAKPNPYTGVSPLADPALAFVVGANENSIIFWSQLAKDGPYPAGLVQRFDQWIRQKYSTPAALAAALPDLTVFEQSGRSPIAAPIGWNGTGPRMALFLDFVSSLEIDSYRWIEQSLRDRHYAGPVLGFHDWYKQMSNRTRAALPIIDTHAYVGEVSNYARGSRLNLPSSLDREGLSPILTNMGSRWLDRPMLFSEYGTPFPNPYRRESGLLSPALAAFQGYNAMCRMANLSVEPQIPADGPPIYPYRVGIDPVSRVAETLSTLLFYRGDVSLADKGVVAVPFGSTATRWIGSAYLPAEIRQSALLARFGLIPPGKVGTLEAPATVVPLVNIPYGPAEKSLARLVDMATGSSAEKQARVIAQLRANGTLPATNRTDAGAGLFQSQNGQMTLDTMGGTFSVVTARTEAVTAKDALTDMRLGSMTVIRTDGGALVAASALDGRPLASSGKILLMLVADARNSGLILGGEGTMRTVVDWGRLPILLKHVTADVSLHRQAPFRGTFSILKLNGDLASSRPVESTGDGTLRVSLDTRGTPASPTTYFLLAANSAR